jgi:PAS domain S-box-containing protein
VAFACWLATAPAAAAGPASPAVISPLEVLADPGGALGVEDVSRPPWSRRFRPLPGKTVNLGIAGGARWVRFTVDTSRAGHPERGQWLVYLDNPYVTRARLLVPRPGGGWVLPRPLARDLSPASMPARFTAFRLPPAPGGRRTLYLRIQPSPIVLFQIEAMQERDLLLRYNQHTLWFGVYAGCILALALYNLFLFISLRDRAYLWYVLTITSFILFHACLGGFLQLMGPDLSPLAWGQVCLTFLAFSAMCRAMFARHYLLTPDRARWLNRLLWLFFGLFALLGAGGWQPSLRPWTLAGFGLAGVAFPLFLVATGCLRWRQGFAPAKFFLVPYGFTGIGAVAMSLSALGLLPLPYLGFVLHQAGGGVEAVLLSLALGWRIRSLQRQTHAADHARLSSEARARRVMEATPEPLLVCDRRGRVEYVNPAFTRVMGWEPRELAGDRWWEGMGRRWRRVPDHLARAMAGREFSGRESSLESRERGVVSVSLGAAKVTDHQGRVAGAVLTLQDITGRKQAERRARVRQAQLRRLARELGRAEERQRRAIAEDLHDSITQNLAGALIRLDMLEKGIGPGPAAQVREVREVLDQTLADLRGLTMEISPPVLYDLGLGPALEWLAEHMQERQGLAVEYAWDQNAEALDDDLKITLYRSARELLINVRKHSGVSRAAMALQQRDGEIMIEVADQGAGFEPDAAAGRGRGFGLFSIRQRLALVGGSLEVAAAPGRGARIVLRAPAGAAAAGEEG